MTGGDEIIELLASAPGWQKGVTGSSSESLAALDEKLGATLPESYRGFLNGSNGGVLAFELTRVNFWTVQKVRQMNPDEIWSENIPGIVVFATDEGSFIYFFDSQDVLGHGAWAVFGANMGSVLPRFSIPIATDFADFVQQAIRGDDLFARPYLSEE